MTGHMQTDAVKVVAANNEANNGQYRIAVRKDNATDSKVTLTSSVGNQGGDYIITDDDGTSYVTVQAGNTLGTSAIDIVLQKCNPVAETNTDGTVKKDTDGNVIYDYTWQDVSDSCYTVNTIINQKSSYTSYSVADVATIFDLGAPVYKQDASGNYLDSTDTITVDPTKYVLLGYKNLDKTLFASVGNYKPGVTVYGIVNGTKYVLNTSEYQVFSDNANLNYVNNTLVATGLSYATDASTTTANLTIVVNADTNPIVLPKQVTVSNSGPGANTLSISGTYANTGAVHCTGAAEDNANEISITVPVNTTYDATTHAVTNTGGFFTTADLKAILDNAMVVDDQYAEQLPLAFLAAGNSHIAITDMTSGAGLAGYVHLDPTTGLQTTDAATLLSAGNTFSVTYVVGTKAFSLKVVIK